MKQARAPSQPMLAVWFRFCIAFIALNAPNWLLGHWLFISRPVFNVELVLPLIAAAWSLPASVAVLALTWAFDLMVSQSHSYHFASPLEFLRSARFLSDVHILEFLTADRLLIVLPFVIFGLGALRCAPRRRPPWGPALAVAAILSAIDVANGSSMLWQPGTRLIEANVANAPVLTLAVGSWNKQPAPPLLKVDKNASATGTANLAAWAESHPDGSALVVIIESMGWHARPELRDWLREQLVNPALLSRYQLHEVAIPFKGSTTSAELRELCGLHGSYQSLDAAVGDLCLPSKLARKGWSTVGLHGFSSHMFDRSTWWPLLGIQSARFAQDISATTSLRCGGAFAGMCDATVIQTAVEATRTPRRLVYALTLNSHLPLSAIDIPADLKQRCLSADTGDDVCRLTATIAVALRALRDSITASSTSPEVIVVGDHSPPFASLRARDQYDAQQVPAFILTPN